MKSRQTVKIGKVNFPKWLIVSTGYAQSLDGPAHCRRYIHHRYLKLTVRVLHEKDLIFVELWVEKTEKVIFSVEKKKKQH